MVHVAVGEVAVMHAEQAELDVDIRLHVAIEVRVIDLDLVRVLQRDGLTILVGCLVSREVYLIHDVD